ncbi:CIA30 family protein [Rheinheimera salexigens]|uniref:NADH:ubiquinone oxidoreductase intermediate-associated protein 30 domain-containing protein n=1 Tax=Rheinheimera salexigens TaxID=1628148 RepID=A0A1E7Q6H9_9GAMM|nr:CIA30 family protein [Rheinheimera salexigens]OEY69648.1 hypothetical protein BI198_08825 [Rheinheimera salexigens]
MEFFGDLSLDNNGGFSSVEFSLVNALPEHTFQQLRLTVAGDGRRYQLKLKPANLPNGVAFAAGFDTTDNQTFQFTLSDFSPRYRGRQVTGLAPLRFADINQISIMLADKTAAAFNIKLFSIQID